MTARRHSWGPGRPRMDHARLLAMLADFSKTIPELARETGYSRNWLQTLASAHEIARPRGGDRKSRTVRSRFGTKLKWTDDRVDDLRGYLADGLTIRQMVPKFDGLFSRNSIGHAVRSHVEARYGRRMAAE